MTSLNKNVELILTILGKLVFYLFFRSNLFTSTINDWLKWLKTVNKYLNVQMFDFFAGMLCIITFIRLLLA